MSDLFYVFGIALTLAALVLSFVGLRAEKFPGSRGLLVGVLGGMTALVAASCAFAVVLSREEADHREEEVAEFEAEQAAEEAEASATEEEQVAEEDAAGAPADEQESEGPQQAPETLAITSPADGSLIFEPDKLDAAAGEVEIEYTNPSSTVPHNVAIEFDGETVAQSETVQGGESASALAELDPGSYTYYCSIPGHREAGMEGALTVD
jgi:plastocyanin